jgi:hypothetical protein
MKIEIRKLVISPRSQPARLGSLDLQLQARVWESQWDSHTVSLSVRLCSTLEYNLCTITCWNLQVTSTDLNRFRQMSVDDHFDCMWLPGITWPSGCRIWLTAFVVAKRNVRELASLALSWKMKNISRSSTWWQFWKNKKWWFFLSRCWNIRIFINRSYSEKQLNEQNELSWIEI